MPAAMGAARRPWRLRSRRVRSRRRTPPAKGRNRPGPGTLPEAPGERGHDDQPAGPWPGSPKPWAGGSRPGAGGRWPSGGGPDDQRGPRRRWTGWPGRARLRGPSVRHVADRRDLRSPARLRRRPRPDVEPPVRPAFPTTPRRPASASPTTTVGRRRASSPRRWAAGSACSTTTATAGSTSTASRAGRSRPRRRRQPRRTATACSATGATGPSRMSRDGRGSRRLPGGYGHGVAVGDYDNDGRPDLFVTRWRSYALYRNRGDGTFEDVTGAAGLGGRPGLADLGGLRRPRRRRRPRPLRLPLPGLGRRAPARSAAIPHGPGRTCTATPGSSTPLPDHLFRNDGGRFVDVTAEAGHRRPRRPGPGRGRGRPRRRRPGRPFVANDTTANYLFRNLGGLRFEEVGVASGVAAQRRRRLPGRHGGRLRRPRRRRPARPGRHQLLRRVDHALPQPGRRRLRRPTAAIGLAAASRSLLGFGIAFLDVNNDGRLDLATANGHVNDYRPTLPYAMPAQLLAGVAGGRLIDVSDGGRPAVDGPAHRPGPGRRRPRQRRPASTSLIVAQDEPLAYFHNRTAGGHSLTFRLEGTALEPRRRRGPGDRRQPAGRRQVARRVGGGSYQSACRPAAPLRARRGRSGRVGRGPLAVGPGRPPSRPAGRRRLPAPRRARRAGAPRRIPGRPCRCASPPVRVKPPGP